jgi:hypothetical protein
MDIGKLRAEPRPQRQPSPTGVELHSHEAQEIHARTSFTDGLLLFLFSFKALFVPIENIFFVAKSIFRKIVSVGNGR